MARTHEGPITCRATKEDKSNLYKITISNTHLFIVTFETLEFYTEIRFSSPLIDPRYTLEICINFVNFLAITPKTYSMIDISSLFSPLHLTRPTPVITSERILIHFNYCGIFNYVLWHMIMMRKFLATRLIFLPFFCK